MYVDGFVLAVSAANRDAYVKAAREAAEVFKEHGATRVVECWGDDVPEGKLTSFPMAVKLAEGEVVCFSWIEYPDKETRDACHKKVEVDPRLEPTRENSPFDGARMIYGGFAPVLDV